MKITQIIALSILTTGSLSAQEATIVGTTPLTLKTHESSLITTSSTKAISLLNIHLSDRAKQFLITKANATPSKQNQFMINKQTAVQLGMNNVPVLDQGAHGTCVTFSITAAIDAALQKGDYISQLCQLQLGSFLENNGYGVSGWSGTFGRPVLSQLDSFGFVNKATEASQGCGGVTQYPLNDSEPSSSISVEAFHQISAPFSSLNDTPTESPIYWSQLLDIDQVFVDQIDTNNTLTTIKKALSEGNRVTFGVLLASINLGNAGAVGTHTASYDSWVLTPEIKHDIVLNPPEAGHEMVITGFDDNAVAIDSKGRQYRGLFTLRNSWGKHIGDNGNFYMSYDYFKMLVIEAYQIRN